MSRMLSPQWWKLDAEQEAVFRHDGPCVVIAGPGSGKTRTVVARAARLLHIHGLRAVAMATFSNAATRQMRSRLAKVLPGTPESHLRVATLHAMSVRMLRARTGGQQPQIIEEQASRDLIRRCAIHLGVEERRIELIITQVQALKASSLDLLPDAKGHYDFAQAVAAEYQARLALGKVMDMADLVREATLGLRSGELKLDAEHLIVDEAQDIDPIQLELISACIANGATLTAVADDDQSIYGFRCALGHSALKALADCAGAAVLHLENNYRSGRDIVEGAAFVIEDAEDRFAKKTRAVRTEPGLVRLRSYLDEGVQAQAISDEVVDLMKTGQGESAAGVIARTNLELDLIEAALLAQDVAVERLGGTGLLKREQVRRFLGLLMLADAPDDALRLLSGMELLGVSRSSRAWIDKYLRSGCSSDAVLDRLYDTDLLEGLGRQDATLFKAWRDDVVRYVEAITLASDDSERSRALLEHTPLLLGHSRDARVRQDGMFLARLLARYRKGSITTRIKAFERPRSPKSARATVLTAHASKGLEFNAVWVINCNDARFPLEGADLDEERRLFYVAMTRAQDRLTLSSLSKEPRSPFVETLRRKASESMDRGQVLDSPTEVPQQRLDQGLHGFVNVQSDLVGFELQQAACQ